MTGNALVVVHIYYSDQVDLILTCLRNISLPYDLYCTIANGEDYDKIKNKVLTFNPKARIVDVVNVGYDIWPFVNIINNVDLSNYKYIIKLHTKRDIITTIPWDLGNGFFIGQGSYWRDSLYDFIATKDNFDKCLKALQSAYVGMCTRFNMIHKKPNMGEVIDYARRKYPKYKFNLDNYDFVAGTMFVAKAEPFQMIKNMKIHEDLFEKPTIGHDTQFAHVIERVIGETIYKSGMVISDPFTDKKYIRRLKTRYKKLNWIRRVINYLVLPIPFGSIRRRCRCKLVDIFYFSYLKYIINSDRKHMLTKRGKKL